jgi:hypothetical protein
LEDHVAEALASLDESRTGHPVIYVAGGGWFGKTTIVRKVLGMPAGRVNRPEDYLEPFDPPDLPEWARAKNNRGIPIVKHPGKEGGRPVLRKGDVLYVHALCGNARSYAELAHLLRYTQAHGPLLAESKLLGKLITDHPTAYPFYVFTLDISAEEHTSRALQRGLTGELGPTGIRKTEDRIRSEATAEYESWHRIRLPALKSSVEDAGGQIGYLREDPVAELKSFIATQGYQL